MTSYCFHLLTREPAVTFSTRQATSVVSPKCFETQLRILRLHLALNHPSDKDLSLGTPEMRQIPLGMTNLVRT
jgi:hypothetical protein